MIKIAIAQIIHESNTFAPNTTPLSDFRIKYGDEMVRFYSGAHNEVTGFLEGASIYNYEVVPTFCANATPSGTVKASAFDWLANELVRQLQATGQIDGILLSLHGAFVSENFANADAEFARRVREAFGSHMPIVLTHDPHSSVSEDVVKQVDALVIYKTNPHIDQRERGLQAARILCGIVRGEVKPTMAYRALPMMINIVHQHTSSPPLRDLWRELTTLEQQPGVLATSMSLCYQYSDVPAMGNVVVVVTNNNQAQADAIADDLSAKLWGLREALTVNIPDVSGAVNIAMNAPAGPFVIVDIGDNVGGGSAADSTFLLHELLAQSADGWVVTLADPESVQACAKAGIGAMLTFDVGGKTDNMHGAPVTVTGRVKCLHDGKYEERAARHGGVRWGDQGLSALIEIHPNNSSAKGGAASYILLTSHRAAPMSLHQLQSVGIEPTYMKILTVKAAIAWKAAYEPIMTGFVVADTPGATQVNPRRWEYKHTRAGLWGLEGW
jgi:microcystin degradation protein MlrC